MSNNGARALPPGWAKAALGDIVDILDRFRVPVNSEERAQRLGNVPYYGATGPVGWIDDYLFDEELVILGEDGAPFLNPRRPKAYLIRGKSWVNNHAHVLRAKPGILNSFLMYQLNQSDFREFVSGTTRLKLPQAPMRLIPMVVAPAAEQHRIVAEIEKHFTRLDAAVAALKRVRANLKRYRASVLKAACEGRLVPTEAELAQAEGRDYEPADVLLQRILTERRARWEADELAKMQAKGKRPKDDRWKAKYKEPEPPDGSELPDLPEGWVWATVDGVSTAIVDCPHSTPMWSDSGRICVRTTEFRPGKLDLSSARFVSQATYRERIKRLKPTAGDILYSREGGILGIACMVPENVSLCLGQRMMLIRVALVASPTYVMHWLNSSVILQRVKMLTGGSASPHLNVRDIVEFPISLPPLAEQHRIVAEVERRLSVIDGIEAQVEANLKRAEHLRQAILKRAFEGKLVPQDPDDEPASVLLERIRAERETAGTKAKGRQKRGATNGKRKEKPGGMRPLFEVGEPV